LRGVRNNLAPGGYGLVEVPDFAMMLEKEMFSEFTIDHLAYYTPATLRRMLEINGFEVLDCRSVWHHYIISAEVRRRPATDFSGFGAAAERLFAQIANFCGEAPRRELAVWGAGHQAFALLAASRLAERFSCILDSAKFKQGRFAPATGLPIVPPETLDMGEIRRVLIMAGSYSDEIAARIRSRYGKRHTLALVREDHLETIP
ncbi:MAG: methyltransferase, partial [Lentisphaeria bacterium]|nr:methyltransferase [Lentisphaeria bacterium]